MQQKFETYYTIDVFEDFVKAFSEYRNILINKYSAVTANSDGHFGFLLKEENISTGNTKYNDNISVYSNEKLEANCTYICHINEVYISDSYSAIVYVSPVKKIDVTTTIFDEFQKFLYERNMSYKNIACTFRKDKDEKDQS